MLISNDVTDAADLKGKLDQITKNIMEKLRDSSSNFGIMHLTQTPFAVKFTVQGTRGKIDVDLLPTFHFDGSVATIYAYISFMVRALSGMIYFPAFLITTGNFFSNFFLIYF